MRRYMQRLRNPIDSIKRSHSGLLNFAINMLPRPARLIKRNLMNRKVLRPKLDRPTNARKIVRQIRKFVS